MVDTNLYPTAQSADRENHNTKTALLKVNNDIFVLQLILSTTVFCGRHSTKCDLGTGYLSGCDRIYQGVLTGYQLVGVSLRSFN